MKKFCVEFWQKRQKKPVKRHIIHAKDQDEAFWWGVRQGQALGLHCEVKVEAL